MYNYPDTQIFVPEYRPKNPSPWDDEFDGPGINWNKWTWHEPIGRQTVTPAPELPVMSQCYFNQSSLIYTPNYDTDINGFGNQQIHGINIGQVIPPPYIIEAEVEVYMFNNSDFMSAGLWIGDTDRLNQLQWFIQKTSSNTLVYTVGARSESGFTTLTTTSIAAYNGVPTTFMQADYMRLMRLRIRNDGVNVWFDMAPAISNSFSYYNIYSTTLLASARLTPSSNFSACGLRMQPGTRCSWFRAKQGTVSATEIL